MSQGTLWFAPIQRALNAAAQNVSGALAWFYAAGTTTPITVFSDVTLLTPLTQPVVADGNGIFVEIFLTPGTAYKVDLQTSLGVSLTGYPADNQLAIPASASTVDTTETAGESLTAGQVAYLSDGSGGKIAGQLYKADSTNPYSSTIPTVGLVPTSIASGSQGLFRIEGFTSGFSSLTIGADYFVGSAGALTLTPPTNARYVGRADTASSLIVAPNPPLRYLTSPVVNTSLQSSSALFAGICQGRLTLTTGVPVTTTDVTGATTIYFTPYAGNNLALYDGSALWTVLPFVEISIALGTLSSGLPYDVFAYNNSGTVALRAPVPWTNTTTRATDLLLQNGVLVKTGATTDRYLGTFFTTTTTQTEDSVANGYLWNYYHRVNRPLLRQDTTSTWSYTTATIRQANGAAANQVNLVIGVSEDPVEARIQAFFSNATAAVPVAIGVGVDSTTTVSGEPGSAESNGTGANQIYQLIANYRGYPGIGKHSLMWNEYSNATGTTQWFGQNVNTPNATAGIAGLSKH